MPRNKELIEKKKCCRNLRQEPKTEKSKGIMNYWHIFSVTCGPEVHACVKYLKPVPY